MNTIKFFIKTFITILLYMLIYGLIYSIIILKTSTNISILFILIFSSIGMAVISFCYGNHFKKYGLIVGLVTTIIHLLIIKLIYYFSSNTFEINALKVSIQIIVGGIGGIIGSNVKKIF